MFNSGRCRLEFRKKRNAYENSSKSCVFKCDDKTAWSFEWWQFFGIFNGVAVFNEYSYSPTTSAHQGEIHSLLQTLGIRIDVSVELHGGLQRHGALSRALAEIYTDIYEAQLQLQRKGTRDSVKERLTARIAELEAKIPLLRKAGAKCDAKTKAACKRTAQAGETAREKERAVKREKEREIRAVTKALEESGETVSF